MKILAEDFSDFYIEKYEIYNPCNEYLSSEYYIKYAKYNIFGFKYYTRYPSVHGSKENALNYWRTKRIIKEIIKYKTNCNE